MLLRRYHKVEKVKEVVEVKEINLEPVIEQIESEVDLEELTVSQLKEIAIERQIEVPNKIKKEDLIKLIVEG